MSGPALKSRSSHRAIHEEASEEARALTGLLRDLTETNENQARLLLTAYTLVEHWETNILAHAEAEEEDLYVTVVKENPKLRDKVLELTIEHELLRNLIDGIKDILEVHGVNEDVLTRFDTLLLVNEIHNFKEENQLLIKRSDSR